jgi:molybdate transport system substrate-binding protein
VRAVSARRGPGRRFRNGRFQQFAEHGAARMRARPWSTVMERHAKILFALVVGLAALIEGVPSAQAQSGTLTVFAAASLKNALDEVDAAFTAKTGTKVVASYAASSALIRQIEQGAPADVFFSADLDWMDYGDGKQLVKSATRVNLLGNRLVLIAPQDSRLGAVAIGPGFDLAGLAGDGRIVTGDVRAVPAGKYAQAALEKLGAWQTATPKLAMTENVRAALTLVARGEATLGIVYETDAQVEPRVKIIGVFPADSHPAIIYPVAATAAAKPEADGYIAFLRTQVVKSIFEKYRFTFLVRPTS